jgi:OmpA-OmpF porin, OOP family
MHAQLRLSARTDQDGTTFSGSSDLHTDGGYAGVGVGYDYNEHFSLGLGYDGYYAKVRKDGVHYDSDVGVISGAATYRF